MTGDRKAPSLFVREPQLVEKVCFFKKSACSQSLSPNPFPHGKGLCMLGWLCVLQSLAAYTPGIRAGAILLGLPPLDPVGGYAPATPFSENTKVYRQTERTGFPVLVLRLNFQPHFFILRQTKHICQLYYIQREKLRGNDL